MATGGLGAEEADVIVAALDRIPAGEDRSIGEDIFTDALAETDQAGVAQLARRLAQVLDPDGAEPADPAKPERSFDYRLGQDGSLTGRLRLDPERAELLRTALDPLAKPRPATGDGDPDSRSTAERAADALTELARTAIRGGELPDHGGEPPNLLITIGWEQLRAGLGAVTLGDGTVLPVETVRRLGCESRVIPMVLGSHSEPLDIGRASRTVTKTQRRAVTARDRHCAFPGCEQRAPRCDVHHVIHWADGGLTDLDNLVLLCGWHHTVIHHTDWSCRITNGHHPIFTPPEWYPPRHNARSRPRYKTLTRCQCGGLKIRRHVRT